MPRQSNKLYKILTITSTTALLLFLFFYVIAALNYPGGSYSHPQQGGFSFMHNYLCDLLDDIAINGIVNDGKIYARIALGCLCLGVLLFWLVLPGLLKKSASIKSRVIVACGVGSMLVTVFLAAGNHDLVTRLAGILGSIAMVLGCLSLFENGYKKLALLGWLCLLLTVLNFVSYETGYQRNLLPFFQKITFCCFLFWFLKLNFIIKKL